MADLVGDAGVTGEPNHYHARGRSTLLIKSIFLLLGVGVLVPWNAFISAKDYFESRLCANHHDVKVESTFAMVYNLASVFCVALIIAVQAYRDHTRVASNEASNPQMMDTVSTTDEQTVIDTTSSANSNQSDKNRQSFWLVVVPLSLFVASFLGQTVMVLFMDTTFFFQLTILCLVICGVSCGVAQAGIVVSAGLFHADLAMNPYLMGQSLGGVFVSAVNFITAMGEDPEKFRDIHCTEHSLETGSTDSVFDGRRDDQVALESCSLYQKIDWSIFIYFLLGTLVLLACIRGYHLVATLPLAGDRADYEIVRTNNRVSEPSHRIGLELHKPSLEPSPLFGQDPVDDSIGDALILDQLSVPVVDDPCTILNDIMSTTNQTTVVWKHVHAPVLTIFLTFFVTLSLFPGWTSEMHSVHRCYSRYRIVNDLYVPFGFVLFNVGDLCGRLISARIPLETVRSLSTKLVGAACLRFLFFPLLYLCTDGSDTNRFSIQSDFYSETVQFAFAASNGFLLSTAFQHAPQIVPNTPSMQARMSEMLSFAVSFGLLCGSLFSFPVAHIMSK